MSFNVDAKFLGESVENKTLLEKYGNINSIALLLSSDLKSGLTTDENNMKERKEHFGENFIPPKMPHTFFYYLAKAFQDFMLIFLICGGVVMFATEMAKDPKSGGIDGVAIILAVVIIVFVTSINDYTKERKFKDLHKTIKMGNTCSVLRDGNVVEICTKDLVVGDIYLPTYGDQVPADGIVIQANGLKAEESAITGESDLVAKDIINNPYILSGTHIMEGSGKALIVAVGYYSQTGRILKLLGAASKETKPKIRRRRRRKEKSDVNESKGTKCRSILQEKLTKLALLIGKFGVTAGTLVFIILLIRFCVRTYAGPSPRGFLVTDLLIFLEFLMEGFTVVIVAVPEGLPLAVTLSLAYSVTRMLKDNNLVRQLYSCETMGNATTICSDKTGTLTTNRMTVVQLYVLGTNITKFTEIVLPDLMRECVVLNICVNKSPAANIRESNVPGALPIQMGNKTECALLGFLTYLNVNYKKYLLKFSSDSIIKTFPFNSEKKLMSAVVDIGNGIYRILVKGAPDVLLDKCKYEFVGINGEIDTISQGSMRNYKDTLSDMASDSLRTILLAYRDFERMEIPSLEDENYLINELTILCIVGIDDPVRPDVPLAIKTCISAGITVRMVTGDNIVTARAIAKKCGILGSNRDELILDSEKFNALIKSNGVFDQDLFDKVWPKLRVLARSSPKDKYVLVNGILNTKLKDKQVVAVTGDGTNDAPALKRADVGFAMGLTGTDIAKEASDIIITDDNFASIVRAILWGRNVYDSISKFIQFQLTVNLSAIMLSIITTTSYGENVLKPSQLLWVNLVMDTFASLALATDTPTNDLLKRKPYSRNRGLLSTNMVVFIILHSIFQITAILVIVYVGPTLFSIDSTFGVSQYNNENNILPKDTIHGTLIFNVFVLMQIFNEFNARKVHGERNIFKNIFKNKLFIAIILITIVVQVLIVQFTYKFFHVVPLSLELWLWSIFIGSLVLVYHQLVVINMEFLISIPKRFRIQKGIPSSVIIPEENTRYDAKLLWIRGLKKLQQELRVIQAFKDGLVVKNEFDQGSVDELNDSI